jgi:hypothetical protein
MIHRFIYLIGLLFVVTFTAQAQTNAWGSLMLTTTTQEFDPTLGMEVDIPNIHPAAKQLAGSEIELEGFILPLEGKKAQSHFMFSTFPINMCYFCGRAGPESVIEVFMKNGTTVPFTDNKIWLKGVLRINEGNPQSNIYTLEHAEKL